MPVQGDMCSRGTGWACGALGHGGAISFRQEDEKRLPEGWAHRGPEGVQMGASWSERRVRLERSSWKV